MGAGLTGRNDGASEKRPPATTAGNVGAWVPGAGVGTGQTGFSSSDGTSRSVCVRRDVIGGVLVVIILEQ